jgi:hypothetical protein
MSFRILVFALTLVSLSLPATAGEPSWKGKTVILVRPGVELRAPEGGEDRAEDERRRQGFDVPGEGSIPRAAEVLSGWEGVADGMITQIDSELS